MLLPIDLQKRTNAGPFVASSVTLAVYPVTVQSSTRSHTWIYRRFVLPILALLRMGATPRRLAWSLAVGLLIGVNPVLGTTTALCLAVSFIFRLNIVAAQVANHLAFPLELALLMPLIRLGSLVFHTTPMPLSAHVFMTLARTSPFRLLRQLWVWEWHALAVWAAISVLAVPVIAISLTPLLKRMLARVQRHEYPVVPLGSMSEER